MRRDRDLEDSSESEEGVSVEGTEDVGGEIKTVRRVWYEKHLFRSVAREWLVQVEERSRGVPVGTRLLCR